MNCYRCDAPQFSMPLELKPESLYLEGTDYQSAIYTDVGILTDKDHTYKIGYFPVDGVWRVISVED